MKKQWLVCISLLSLLGISGCANGSCWSWFRNPGTATDQQHRAQKFDPYPATTPGAEPPMAGVRPRDYDRPYNDTQRNYFDRTDPNWGTNGRSPQN